VAAPTLKEMAMHGSTLVRSLVASVALVVAGSAQAQSADKDRPAASKQGSAKPAAAKAAPSAKRHDFIPGSSLKETSTRPAMSQPAQSPVKQGSGCESQDVDA
jgi:hypothetical protein